MKEIILDKPNASGEQGLDLGISVFEWKRILEDETITSKRYKETLIKFFLEPNHGSTCKHIATKYYSSPSSIIALVTNFAKAVQKDLGDFQIKNELGENVYWIIPMKGRTLENGLFEWRLTENLVLALEEIFNTTYTDFKHLLEYFVAHLEYVQNKTTSHIGYSKYIAPLIKDNNFSYTGQGYKNGSIQNQVKEWEFYFNEKICINIQDRYGKGFDSKRCYLNWGDTGINILAKWSNNTITGLFQSSYNHWEDNPSRNNLGIEKNLIQLDLFSKNKVTDDLKFFFNNYYSEIIKYRAHIKNSENEPMNRITKLLENKKQIILQGPPGTGKTRMAKEIASKLNAENTEIIQFHPSYTYEDFVRGITVKNEGDTIAYKTENKVLAKIAKKAHTNYKNYLKDDTTLGKELQLEKYFDTFKDHILDEIEKYDGFLPLTENVGLINLDTDAFRYKGKKSGWVKNGNRMLFKDILQTFSDGNTERQHIKNNPNVSGLAFQHASYFVRVLNLFQKFLEDNELTFNNQIQEKEPLKKYVLIIDEINRANLSSVLGELIYALEYRGEPVKSMYEKEGEGNNLILPPNLYIIGTMNTADRSVGQIDYAIRRRFAFVDVLPKILTEEELNKDKKEGEPLLYFATECFEKVKALFVNEDESNSEHLSDEFNPKDVQLGHSYFIYSEDNFRYKLEYEIKPILKEYVTDGILKDNGDKKIMDAINSL